MRISGQQLQYFARIDQKSAAMHRRGHWPLLFEAQAPPPFQKLGLLPPFTEIQDSLYYPEAPLLRNVTLAL